MYLKKDNLPWVEKYRPNTIDNVIYQDDVVNLLKETIKKGDLPHLLLHGPAGSGKTTIAISLAKQLFQGPIYGDRVLELNASDERGIKIVREKIKKFSQLALNRDTDYPPFKIIILDEVDAMTDDSQFALRRIIEEYSRITRFILICNYVTRIIEPLSSRCAKYRFRAINEESMKKILTDICKKEDVQIMDVKIFEMIYQITKGDMRKAITMLQRCSFLDKKKITIKTLEDISGTVPTKLIINIFKVLKNIYDYTKLQKLTREVISKGYSGIQLLDDIALFLVTYKELDDNKKGYILEKISDCEYLLNKNSDEYLQLLNIFAFIMEKFHEALFNI